ncbi:ABC transporter permease [Roseibium polysiphoniae]|uniref:ABC transporter permease n=1 Tax=Roseibium polysiphoniae TaxID=2571221 RepID=A0A944CG24_9HYPH|nr:ABC transporter permease [Roseibium polysiphoniae]MBS8261917.1 ABC transporter permease [Roseibium polysiphoniae]
MNAFVAKAPTGLSLALRFALRELRGGFKGFYIFIACIALGVAAIAGVTSISRGLTEGISAEGQSILGGDISFSIVHRETGEDESAWLQTLGDVSSVATMRAMARRPETGDQALVEMKAVDGAYPLYGEMALEGGGTLTDALSQKDGLWGAVADLSLLARLGLEPGDTLAIGRATVRISDVIANEPDKLAGGMELGPRLMISQSAIPETGLIQPGSLVRWRYRVKLPGTASEEAVKGVIAEAEETFPDAGWRVRSRANAAPGLQRNINRFAQFLTLVGLTALVVGGVGVANAIRAFLDTKREVIASFKCLGATGGFAFQVYLIQMLCLAAIGIGIGLLVGAILPFAAGAALSGVLPVDLAAAIYPQELGLGLLYGILTALAFALWPLGRAHDVPPTALFRDMVSGKARSLPRKRYLVATAITVLALAGIAILLAYDKRIALIYIGASASAFVLLVLVARLIMAIAKRLPTVRSTELRLAIANIHRPGALTPSVVLSLGLGLSLLVALALIDGNLRRELTATIAQEAPSFFFVDIQSHERDAFETLLSNETDNANLRSVPMLRGRLTSLKGVPTSEIEAPPNVAWILRGDRGITYEAEQPENAELTSGDWWPADYSGKPLVSFEDEAARELGLTIGDEITVNVLGRDITAEIANTRKVEWRSLAINFVLVFSPNTFAGAPHAHLMTLGWDENVSADQELDILRSVSSTFPTVTAVRVKDAIAQVNDLVAQLAWAIRGASSITLIASILVLAGALAAGNRSRIYDAVILKTLGATRGRLILAYALEYAILGIVTAVFALVAGGIAAWFVITQVMGGSFVMLPVTAMTAALIALVLTVGFGLIGTWKVLGEKPAPVLRNL